MTISVHAPNGDVVDFPDGTDDATINEAMSKAYSGQAGATPNSPVVPQAQQPQTSGPPVAKKPDEELGLYDATTNPIFRGGEALNGLLAHAIGQPGADAVDRAGNSLFPWLGDHTTAELQAQKDAMNASASEAGVKPGLAGDLAGSVLGTAPVTMLPGVGPVLGGAIQGAGQSHSDTPGGVARDTIVGGALGKAGDVATKMVGGVLNPIVSPYVQRMLDMGVRLTPGQIAGGIGQRLEDTLQSAPGIGDLIMNAKLRGMGDFNRGLVNQTLKPIGMKLPDDVNPGHEAVTYAQTALGNAYDHVLSGVSANIDPQFTADFRRVAQTLSGAPKDIQNHFRDYVSNTLTPLINGARGGGPGAISGTDLKTLESELGAKASQFMSGDGFQKDLGKAYQGLQGALRDQVARSNPQVASTISSINQGWANLSRLESAAGKADVAPGGVITPRQYKGAVNQADTTVRNRASAAGRARGQQDAEAGEAVLGKMPVIDNARRMLVNGAGLAGGAGAIMMHVNPMMAIPLAAGAAAYTKFGQAGMQAAMTARPAISRLLGQGVETARPLLDQLLAAFAPHPEDHKRH